MKAIFNIVTNSKTIVEMGQLCIIHLFVDLELTRIISAMNQLIVDVTGDKNWRNLVEGRAKFCPSTKFPLQIYKMIEN